MLGKIEGGRRRGRQRMRWLDGITNPMDMCLSKLLELVKRQGSLVCCSPWGHKESNMNEWLNWTDWKILHVLLLFSPGHLWCTTDIFIFSIVLLFSECLIVGIIQYVAFSDQLLSVIKLIHIYIPSISFHGLKALFFLFHCFYVPWFIYLL